MRTAAIALNLALLLVVFYLGTVSAAPEGVPLPGNDKIGHALAFFSVGIAQYLAFFTHDWPRPGRGGAGARFALSTVGATLVGGLLEVVQMFLPFRNAEFADLLADAVGATLGACLLLVLLG